MIYIIIYLLSIATASYCLKDNNSYAIKDELKEDFLKFVPIVNTIYSMSYVVRQAIKEIRK